MEISLQPLQLRQAEEKHSKTLMGKQPAKIDVHHDTPRPDTQEVQDQVTNHHKPVEMSGNHHK
jgi:hypothetical protein